MNFRQYFAPSNVLGILAVCVKIWKEIQGILVDGAS